MHNSRRVVITGLGTINPLGHCVDEFWRALIACESGIRPIERFNTTGFTSRIGGEIPDWKKAVMKYIDSREAKRMDRFAQFAAASAVQAVEDSGLDFDNEDRTRCGVILGSGIGGLEEIEKQHLRMLNKGPSRVSPFTVPKMMLNAATGNILLQWHLRGVNTSVVTACASATNAIGDAIRSIRLDEADVIITGGAEAALTKLGLGSFCALKGLSTRNDDPVHASRPFDRDRDGFLLAEGAGIVIVEELEHARKRGAKIYAELIGFGASSDGYHITAPDPEGRGAIQAMSAALRDAQINSEQVEYVNAHGTSTTLGDIAESDAIKKLFGKYAKNGLMVSSTKSSTGHLLGASGGVELIATVLALRDNVLPATLNLDNPDEKCDLDYIPNTPREKKIDIALSNSFGFGGHNACLLVKRFEG